MGTCTRIPHRKRADRGNELRLRANPGIRHHLWYVLVPLVQSIGGLKGQCGQARLGVFPPADQGVATAGIAGQGIDRKWSILGQKPGVNQWPQQKDEPRGVAARVGYILGLPDGLSLTRYQFRQPVGPAPGDTVSRAGVR